MSQPLTPKIACTRLVDCHCNTKKAACRGSAHAVESGPTVVKRKYKHVSNEVLPALHRRPTAVVNSCTHGSNKVLTW